MKMLSIISFKKLVFLLALTIILMSIMSFLNFTASVQAQIVPFFTQPVYETNHESINGTPYVYLLNLRNRTPTVNQGDTVEIEIFLAGYGIPEKNKLVIQWSSPYILDESNPGSILKNIIGGGIDPKTGKKIIVAGKYFAQTSNVTSIGATIILPPAFFWDDPQQPDVSPGGLKDIVSTMAYDGEPPILLKLNTSKHARPGDYDINFTFIYGNYGDDKNLFQDYKTIPFHITNWWERNEVWISVTAVMIALISLLATSWSGWKKLFWFIVRDIPRFIKKKCHQWATNKKQKKH
jgi:hypothetical protein